MFRERSCNQPYHDCPECRDIEAGELLLRFAILNHQKNILSDYIKKIYRYKERLFFCTFALILS